MFSLKISNFCFTKTEFCISVSIKKKQLTQRNRFAGVAFLLFNKPCSYLESSFITTHCGQTASVSTCICCLSHFSREGSMHPRATYKTPHAKPQAYFSGPHCVAEMTVNPQSLFPIWNTQQRKQCCWCFASPLPLYESQSHIPELETLLSERVRAFLDWLQDNRAFSSTIHVIK